MATTPISRPATHTGSSRSGRRLWHLALAVVGFLLSPLTWWNDLFVNVPLAYLAAIPVAWVWPAAFTPAFVIAYWLTNLVGLMLMDQGLRGMMRHGGPSVSLRRQLLYGVAYSVLILCLALSGYLTPPVSSLNGMR